MRNLQSPDSPLLPGSGSPAPRTLLSLDSTHFVLDSCQTADMQQHRTPAKTIVFSVLALAVFLGVIKQVSAKPNFSGEWKMNPVKSNFAPLPQPDKLVRRISLQDSRLRITTTQFGQGREIVTDLSYTTDGAECKNTIRGEQFTGTARWDGDALAIESRREVQGREIVQTENWTLSSDGQTMTIVNRVQTPQATFDITIVLEKQQAR
jgi:hypothetical protein